MKIIIAGGRYFNDYEKLKSVCDDILPEFENVSLVSGCASGADKLGERYAREHGYKVKEFKAEWNNLSSPCVIGFRKNGSKFNKLAGPNRNRKMAEYADGLIAFWDNKSKGTKNMIKEAGKEGLMIVVSYY